MKGKECRCNSRNWVGDYLYGKNLGTNCTKKKKKEMFLKRLLAIVRIGKRLIISCFAKIFRKYLYSHSLAQILIFYNQYYKI